MTWRHHFLAGVVLSVIGLLALAGAVMASRGSLRDHLRDNYTHVRTSDGGRSSEYTSPRPASTVAASIASKWKPAERLTDPGGYFLRYRNEIVAVTPNPEGGGSQIFVDDQRRGYTRWYPYVGGYWGTYSGPGESFRGGGPGAGK